jgi:hypothetical protein
MSLDLSAFSFKKAGGGESGKKVFDDKAVRKRCAAKDSLAAPAPKKKTKGTSLACADIGSFSNPNAERGTTDNKKWAEKPSVGGEVKYIEREDKSYRQAKETSNGGVEILCYNCRRAPGKGKQTMLNKFFKKNAKHKEHAVPAPASVAAADTTTAAATTASTTSSSVAKIPEGDTDGPEVAEGGAEECGEATMFCSRCRRPMTNQKPKSSGGSNVVPHIVRLRTYKRMAKDSGVPFTLADHEATALMRKDCSICGLAAGEDGHGITRLRIWPPHLQNALAKGKQRKEEDSSFSFKWYMGPFDSLNVATACKMCNLMKGARCIGSYVEAARTVATHCGTGEDYGRYPERMRNNISKRTRSCYITNSSTHTKVYIQ